MDPDLQSKVRGTDIFISTCASSSCHLLKLRCFTRSPNRFSFVEVTKDNCDVCKPEKPINHKSSQSDWTEAPNKHTHLKNSHFKSHVQWTSFYSFQHIRDNNVSLLFKSTNANYSPIRTSSCLLSAKSSPASILNSFSSLLPPLSAAFLLWVAKRNL